MMIATQSLRVKQVLENEISSYTGLRALYTQDQSKNGTQSSHYTQQ